MSDYYIHTRPSRDSNMTEITCQGCGVSHLPQMVIVDVLSGEFSEMFASHCGCGRAMCHGYHHKACDDMVFKQCDHCSHHLPVADLRSHDLCGCCYHELIGSNMV